MLHLKIITPRKIVIDKTVDSVSVPSYEGEITILSHHANLFSLLVEGIIKVKKSEEEEYFSIGGGYLETDGETITILVSKAYGQAEIDKTLTEKALEDAKKILTEVKDEKQRAEEMAMMRRAIVDSKLLKKRHKTTL